MCAHDIEDLRTAESWKKRKIREMKYVKVCGFCELLFSSGSSLESLPCAGVRSYLETSSLYGSLLCLFSLAPQRVFCYFL
jgi:hypothetical protein